VSPCLTNPDQDYKDVVTIVGKAECFSKEAVVNEAVTDKIKLVKPPKRYPVVAVYSFNDLTGQRKSVDGIASFSTAVTMAPDAYLIRAQTRQTFEDKSQQEPLLFAGLIIEGGIVDYNTNLLSGGMGARYLGIGNSKQYREDTVVISLRLVSVSTGEILIEILTSKTILSVGLSNDFFRFIADGTKLVEFESGNAMNESKSIAIQAAMETAVVELITQGREKGYWLYAGE
jgi:curli production assembly/transport component CsgG